MYKNTVISSSRAGAQKKRAQIQPVEKETKMFMLNNDRNSKVDVFLNIVITFILIAALLLR